MIYFFSKMYSIKIDPKYNKYQNPTEQIDVEKKDRLKIIKGLKE